jgi:hypothetical protein
MNWWAYLNGLPELGQRVYRAKPPKRTVELEGKLYAVVTAKGGASNQRVHQGWIGQVDLEVVLFQSPVLDSRSKANETNPNTLETLANKIALNLPHAVTLDPVPGLKIAGQPRLLRGFPADVEWDLQGQQNYCVLEFEYTVMAKYGAVNA